MLGLVLAADPILTAAALIAAIIICLFVLISIFVVLALNIGLAFLGSIMRDKAELIKLLRPHVESLNNTRKVADRGLPLSEDENKVKQALATLPVKAESIYQKVDQSTDRVANAVIEFRARTEQVKTVFKAFFLPGKYYDRTSKHQAGEIYSPGYRQLVEEAPTPPVVEGPLKEEQIQRRNHVSTH